MALEIDISHICRLRKKKWWNPLLATLKFILHFLVVSFMLFLGAVVFAITEDPDEDDNISSSANMSHAGADESIEKFRKSFYEHMISQYGLNMTEATWQKFLEEVRHHQEEELVREERALLREQRKNRMFIYSKWFHFSHVVVTTIGYGDVYPTTFFGKLFFIIFAVTGIPLMMTLLASCGNVVTTFNNWIFWKIQSCVCKGKHPVSEKLLSAITIMLLLMGYTIVGAIFTSTAEKWNFFDSIYYWTVTFTTVGFGDMTSSDDVIHRYVIPIIVYKTFGLALLAGVITAYVTWLDQRRKVMSRKAKLKSWARQREDESGKRHCIKICKYIVLITQAEDPTAMKRRSKVIVNQFKEDLERQYPNRSSEFKAKEKRKRSLNMLTI